MLVMIEQKFQLLARSFTDIMARARTYHVIPHIICLLAFTIMFFIESANSKPYQLLKHKDGYIAVFIRQGDEPLANIDPVLAEAFHEKNFENRVVPIEHQNIDAIEESTINNGKLHEIMLSNINKNNDHSQPRLLL